MGAVLRLARDVRAMSDLPVALGAAPWQAATAAQRRTAELRRAVVAPLAELVKAGASQSTVATLFINKAKAGLLDPNTTHVLAALAADDAEVAVDAGVPAAVPSVPTLKRWIKGYLASSKEGLLPRHTGRVRQAYGWEARAVDLYNIPGKPGFADVAFKLRSEGFKDATPSRVKRYLKDLPATLGAMSPARVGRHLHRLTRQKFQRRHVDELLVGEIYAGDGHTVDCYVAHPNTGKPFRPELTCFIDIKSRYVPGWYFTESESAHSTLFALSHAMLTHQHVPAWLYIDRGAGYRSKLLSDENTGWYSKFDIGVIGALPGNPHGKGWIESFFRTCRDKHDKFFAGGSVYCGHDMAEEVNRRLSAELAMGRRTLPSLQQYVQSFAAFISDYMQEPMEALGGRTRAQLWAELTPIAPELDAEVVLRPMEECSVRRQTVRLHNRHYYAEALALYDGQQVRVEYDLHNDKQVWVLDGKSRLICQAKLANTIGVLPTSRLEEQRDKRLQGQNKRLERKVDEARLRRQDPITAETQVQAITELEHDAGSEVIEHRARRKLPAPPLAPSSGGEVVDIDILEWRNDQ